MLEEGELVSVVKLNGPGEFIPYNLSSVHACSKFSFSINLKIVLKLNRVPLVKGIRWSKICAITNISSLRNAVRVEKRRDSQCTNLDGKTVISI